MAVAARDGTPSGRARRPAGAPPASPASAQRSRLWPVRVARWIAERHGLAMLVPVALLFTLAVAAGATESRGAFLIERVQWWQIMLGGAGFWSWYLMLRVLDDLEDAPADMVAHPDRLLAQGLVSRRDLWALAALSVVVQATASILADLGTGSLTVTLTWLAMLVFLAVVAVDFGMPGTLRQHALMQRVLRIPASMLPVLWAYAIGSVSSPVSTGAPLSWAALALVGIAFTTVALIDITRKFSPAGPGQPSWAGRLGIRNARRLLRAMLAAQVLSCVALIRVVDAAMPLWAIALFLLVVGIGVAGAERARASVGYAFFAIVVTGATLIGAAV